MPGGPLTRGSGQDTLSGHQCAHLEAVCEEWTIYEIFPAAGPSQPGGGVDTSPERSLV